MLGGKMPVQLPRKEISIRAVCISWAEVKRIFSRLEQQVTEQADRELATLTKKDEHTAEQFAANKADLKQRAFRVTVTINGAGESLLGDSPDLFDSPNLPNAVTSVYLTNITAYRGVAGTPPINNFELTLDFSKPPLLDSDNPISSPTPNFSNLVVQGDRPGWVPSILDAVNGVLDAKRTQRNWLHRGFVYDLGLTVIGVPFGLYICWKLSGLINNFFGMNSFLSSVAYLYVMVTVIWLYRLFFGYTKWAFPTVELSEQHSSVNKHRAFWAAILVGLGINFASEILW
jgi:hypothetical protein